MSEIKEHKLSGNAYAVRDILKAAGARWDSTEKAWYVAHEQHAVLQSIIDGYMKDMAERKAVQKTLERENPDAVIGQLSEMADTWLGYMENALKESNKWYLKGEEKVEACRKKLVRLNADTAWIDDELREFIARYHLLPESQLKRKAAPNGQTLKRLGLNDPIALQRVADEWEQQLGIINGKVRQAEFWFNSIERSIDEDARWDKDAEQKLNLLRGELLVLKRDISWLDDELYRLSCKYKFLTKLSDVSGNGPPPSGL